MDSGEHRESIFWPLFEKKLEGLKLKNPLEDP